MDVEQINNFMSNADKEEVSFSDAQWLYLQDINQGSYNNILQYQTTTLKMQFIDYHNAYLRIPMSIECLNQTADSAASTAAAAATTVNHRPSTLALRQSLLNLFTDIRVTTDQGQTIVNDLNCQMINNIRLEVENDEGWMRSEGPYLDYAYDRFNRVPAQTSAIAPGLASGGVATQLATSSLPLSYPSYWAPQGIEAGFATGNPPLTNDPNEFGNNTLASAAVVNAAGATTSIGGVATTGTGSGSIPFVFSDGRVAYFPFTTSAASTFSSFGGVAVANYGGFTGTAQAVGTTSVLDQPNDGEIVTTPVTITGGAITGIGGVAVGATGGGTGTFLAAAYGQISGRNPNANLGFLDRVTYFQNDAEYVYTPVGGTTPNNVVATFGAHTWYYRAIVPLKLLHDFFRQLDFPIINVGFTFQFTFAQYNGNPAQPQFSYPPFQVSNNTYLLAGGGDNTPYPAVYYGKDVGSTSSGTRLYYRVVKFSPADNARVAEKLTSGFTKSIKFISCDWFREPVPVPVGGSSHQFQFSTSVVHPLRVWVLPYAQNTYSGAVANLSQPNTREFLIDPTYAPGIITGHFTQTNILVNSIPYFRQNQQNYADQWEQLREQFDPDNGSMISEVDFRGYKRLLCFDLTRIADRLQSPTEVS